MGSLLAAFSCCAPLGTMLMAAGSAGASAWSERLRPWLLGLSVALLAWAFVQTYLRKRCAFRQRAARTLVLWAALLFVGASLLAPQWTSAFVADRLDGTRSLGGEGRLEEFSVARFASDFDADARSERIVALFSPT